MQLKHTLQGNLKDMEIEEVRPQVILLGRDALPLCKSLSYQASFAQHDTVVVKASSPKHAGSGSSHHITGV